MAGYRGFDAFNPARDGLQRSVEGLSRKAVSILGLSSFWHGNLIALYQSDLSV